MSTNDYLNISGKLQELDSGHAFGAEAVMDPVSRASGPFLPLFILKRKIDLTSDG